MTRDEAPERIYLQLGDPDEETWCQDKVNDDDTEYIRADIVERLNLELRAQHRTLRIYGTNPVKTGLGVRNDQR